MNSKQDKPPANTQSINRWDDLPAGSSPATFEITDENGETRRITLKDGNRRVLEGLMLGPMYCASRVRLSDRKLVLTRDYDITIETEFYGNGDRYGVYTLVDHVVRVGISNREAA